MWYLSRASGMVAWIVLGITCLWGILLVTRMLKPADRPAWLLDLHRYLGVLSLVTTAAHMAALVGDNYVYFGWQRAVRAAGQSVEHRRHHVGRDRVLPAGGHPGARRGLMKWLPRRLWHAIHLLSYVLFAMVTVHGFMAGSDSTNIVFFAVACGGIAILTFALVASCPAGAGQASAAGSPS